MNFDLNRYSDFWNDPDEYLLVRFPPDPDGHVGHLITRRWSGAGVVLELPRVELELVIDRMLEAGVEVVPLSEARRRDGVPKWTHADPQHVVAARPRDAHHVRLSDGRFQRVFPGPDRQLFCGHDHILAAPPLAEVIALAAASTVSVRPATILDPAGLSTTSYVEIVPAHELTPKALFRRQAPATEIWHYERQHLFVSPRLRAEIESRGIPELAFFHGFGALFESPEFRY